MNSPVKILFQKPFLLVLLAMMGTVGCGERLPPGMPKLYKTNVRIIQDGKPLTEARVVMVHEDFTNSPWTSGGITDSKGVASMKTQGQYQGVPKGSYVVTVHKVEVPDIKLPPLHDNASDEEINNYQKASEERGLNSYELVDEKFHKMESSPLRVEVKSSSSHELDVSPVVRKRLPPPPRP